MQYIVVSKLSNKKFKRIVGIKRLTFDLMIRILAVAHAVKHEFGGSPDKASLEDKLLIALSYWREYRTYAHIGVSCGYSESQVCRIIKWCEDVFIASGRFTVGGKKELLTIDKESVILIDVTESPIQRPKKRQKRYYSGKKKRHTMKTQLVIDKNKQKIICLYVANGKTHDFKVLKESKLPIKLETLVVTDSGYQGLQKIHGNTELPKKKSKKQKLSKSDRKANRLLAIKRVFHEQVNGVVKVFRILSEKYRNKRKRFGLRFNLIAGIYNFELNCA